RARLRARDRSGAARGAVATVLGAVRRAGRVRRAAAADGAHAGRRGRAAGRDPAPGDRGRPDASRARGAGGQGDRAGGGDRRGGDGVIDGSGAIVFVGPTLPAAEVAARLPGARVLPPVAVGDVLALRRRSVRRIAIIDGAFEHMAAVWHKEILL